MAISDWLRGAWSNTKNYIEALECAADYDPAEEQRRRVASLEERIKRLETGLPAAPVAQDRSAHRPTRT